MPPVPAAGVPLSTPVAALNVTPPGKVPVSLRLGVGTPLAVTVKLPALPTVKVVLVALVIAGAWAVATVRVKVCVALGVTPLAAVIVSMVDPAGVAVVLARVAVPLPLSTNVTPRG